MFTRKSHKKRLNSGNSQFKKEESVFEINDNDNSDMSDRSQKCQICMSMREPSSINRSCKHHICLPCLLVDIKKQLDVSFIKKNTKMNKLNLKCPIENCNVKYCEKELLYLLIKNYPDRQDDICVKEQDLEVIQIEAENKCKQCKQSKSYLCGHCQLNQLESCAKMNFYSKQQKLEDMILHEMDTDQYHSFQVKHIVINQSRLEELDIVCPVCRDFMQYPHIACAVGHEICRECLFSIKSTENGLNQVCPLCKLDLLPICPEVQRTKQVIQRLSIECPNCKVECLYQNFVQEHFIQCIEPKVTCLHCNKEIEAHFYEIHVQNFCLEQPCPFQCDKLLKDHENFIYDHLLTALKQSDIANSFTLRLSILEKYLFLGIFKVCNACEGKYAWRVENKGLQQNTEFCFRCFRLS